MRRTVPVRDRLLAKTVIDPKHGCWFWTASKNPYGYGQLKVEVDGKRRPKAAHRIAYEIFIGPIPAGLQLDHLCRIRHCINPWHLEPVTSRENTLRGLAPAVARARRWVQTHCKYGHPFDEMNTHITPNGYRECRACSRESMRRAGGRGTQQRTRGRRVIVRTWITNRLAVAECGHEIATTNHSRTKYVICRDCDPSLSPGPPPEDVAA